MQRRSKLSEVAARSWRPCTAPGGPGGPVAQRRSALAGAGVAVEVFLQRPPPAAASSPGQFQVPRCRCAALQRAVLHAMPLLLNHGRLCWRCSYNGH